MRTIVQINEFQILGLDGGITRIAKNDKVAKMEMNDRINEPLVRKVFKLRYLKPTSGGRVDLANQPKQVGGITIQTVEQSIRDILDKSRGSVKQVPGRNELMLAATQEDMQ